MDLKRYPAAIQSLVGRFLDGEATTAPSLRAAVLKGARSLLVDPQLAEVPALPADLESHVANVARHPYRTTDEDMARLKAGGRSEEELFELTVAAALGAALVPLEAGLRALEAAEAAEAAAPAAQGH